MENEDTPPARHEGESFTDWNKRYSEWENRKIARELASLDEQYPIDQRILDLEAQKARDKTKQLIKELKQQEESSSPQLPIINATQLLNTQFPTQHWLVDQLIPAQGFIALTGIPASYKSFITEVLSISLALEKPFLGHFQVTKSAVLIIDKENSAYLLKERLLYLGLQTDDLAPIYFLEDPDHFKISSQQDMKNLITFIQSRDIKLVIFDSFAHIHSGDENDSMAVVKTFEALKQIPCAVLFIHHHRKTIKFFTGSALETIRGSSDIAAELESHIALDPTPDGKIKVSQYKNRRGALVKPFLILPIASPEGLTFEYIGEVKDEITKIQRATLVLDTLLKTGKEYPRAELVKLGESEGIGRDSLDKALRVKEDNKEIEVRKIGTAKFIKLSPNYSPDILLNQEDKGISSIEQSYLDEID